MTDQPTGQHIQREARLQYVPLNRMRINPLAQRDMKQAWVDRLAAHFDLEEMGNPTVNHRDGWFNIIDGQHRTAALKQWLGDWEDQQVQCWVYEGLTDEQEAEKFLKLQDRLRTNAFDEFRIAVSAGRPEESDIERIIQEAGLTISQSKNGIGATGTLRKVYGRGGPEVLARVICIIRDAYGITGFDASVIDGIGMFCQRYDGVISDERVVEKLTKAHGGVMGLINRGNQLRAATGNKKSQCIAAAVVDIINRGRGGGRIPSWWKAASGEAIDGDTVLLPLRGSESAG